MADAIYKAKTRSYAVQNGIRDEMKMRGMVKKSQKFGSGRSAAYPDTELALFR